MGWLWFFCIAFFFIEYVHSLSLDPEASSELKRCLNKSDCIISMRHIRPRRKQHLSIEALFMIDFPSVKQQMTFYLDRGKQCITLDISENGGRISKHYPISNITEKSILRSIALYFHNNRVELVIDCTEAYALDWDMKKGKLQTIKNDPVIKLFRERKYPLYFGGSLEYVFQHAKCQTNVNHGKRRRMWKIKSGEREKNKKRDVGDWFHGNNENLYQYPRQDKKKIERGDIPVAQNDCDDANARSLGELLALVKLLRVDVLNQGKEIAYLRNVILNCAGCQEARNVTQFEITCRSSNPCYPGVECFESSRGLHCGRCPTALVGDGKICKVSSCANNPCFPGVLCNDTISGPQCGTCPLGFDGDGRTCVKRVSCLDAQCSLNNIEVRTRTLSTQSVQEYQRELLPRQNSDGVDEILQS